MHDCLQFRMNTATLGFKNPDPLFTAMKGATNNGFQCSCQGWFLINKGSVFFKTDYRLNFNTSYGTTRHKITAAAVLTLLQYIVDVTRAMDCDDSLRVGETGMF